MKTRCLLLTHLPNPPLYPRQPTYLTLPLYEGNLFFTNAFLGGSFFAYGRSALSYITSDVTDINNPLNEVFPKVTCPSLVLLYPQSVNVTVFC